VTCATVCVADSTIYVFVIGFIHSISFWVISTEFIGSRSLLVTCRNLGLFNWRCNMSTGHGKRRMWQFMLLFSHLALITGFMNVDGSCDANGMSIRARLISVSTPFQAPSLNTAPNILCSCQSRRRRLMLTTGVLIRCVNCNTNVSYSIQFLFVMYVICQSFFHHPSSKLHSTHAWSHTVAVHFHSWG
jgi:hypothetical protein